MKKPAVYILTNKKQGSLYTGVTSDLASRIYEHKTRSQKGFTKKYNCSKLVYCEFHDSMYEAICREKQIKKGTRNKKIELIESINPEWKDLYNP